jgi:hypothetical protein
MSEAPKPVSSGRKGEGLVLGAVTVAAYVGFGAVMVLGDGSQAGVPVDAIRAVAAASDRGEPAVGVAVGEVIPAPPRNSADAVANPVGVRTRSLGGAQIERATDGVVGASDGAGGVTLQFLVKFDEAEAARWRERFLADPNATRAEWEQFARTHAAFSGLKMQLPPNGSGVATLQLEGGAPEAPAAQEALSDDIVRRLNGADGVEYAEPNLVGVREEAPR